MSAPEAGGFVALITGANAGIRKDVARHLALTGRYVKVPMGARDTRKGERARADLERHTGSPLSEVCELHLSDAASVRAAVARLSTAVDLS